MRTIILIIMTVFMFIGSVQVCANEFYGYYTRLNYTIPIDEANDYIPTELTEESLLIIERVEALERAAMAEEGREEYEDKIGEGDEDEEDEDDYEAEVDLEFMAFEDLPEAVRKEARREYPDQPLMGVEIERDSGQVFYHVMFEVNGAEAGMKKNPQGDILDSWHFGEEGEKDGGEEDDEEDEKEEACCSTCTV